MKDLRRANACSARSKGDPIKIVKRAAVKDDVVLVKSRAGFGQNRYAEGV